MLSEAVPAAKGHHHSWSLLPNDIFADIISRVGFTHKAVITVSNTSFIVKHTADATERWFIPPYDLYEFWTTLDNLFTVFIPPFIDTFILDLHPAHYDEPRCWTIMDRWARQLRDCNIQHFTAKGLRRHRSDDKVYPPNFFRMHSLVSLKLNLCDNRIESSVPRSIILLPNLKKLTLDWINYGFLERLLSNCPSLENLSLSVHTIEERLASLKSKKLKRLRIALEGFSINDFIIDAPMLEKLDYYSFSIFSMRMLDSISDVKSLKVEVSASSRRIELGSKTTMMFPNLSHLNLVIYSPEVFKAIGLMLHCPKLEVFELRLDKIYYYRIRKMVWNKEAVFIPVEHVKHIKLYPSMRFDCIGNELLDLVRFLLRSAKVLKKLTINAYDPHSFYLAKPYFYQTLFECAKATSRCQIELLEVDKQP
ncbi:FBD-associated F-box protein At4g10400-like [Silene latifolia]|uniref:FBD-associated F-box protein At4g10400-like n=1 Tax=Silene latifolia TaxID=37657 RepID=UPI003D77180C